MKNNKDIHNKFNILKQEKGGITILILSTILFFLVFLVNLYISSGNKMSSQEKEIGQVEKAYNATVEDMESEYGKQTEPKIEDTDDTKPASAMPSGAEVIEADAEKGIVIKDSKNN